MNKEKIEQEINALQVKRQEIDDEISRKQVLLGHLGDREERVETVRSLIRQFEISPDEVFGPTINKKAK